MRPILGKHDFACWVMRTDESLRSFTLLYGRARQSHRVRVERQSVCICAHLRRDFASAARAAATISQMGRTAGHTEGIW